MTGASKGLRGVVAAACVLAISAWNVAGVALADGPEPCKVATQGDSLVAQACRAGGRPEAKRTMKALVRDAKSRGKAFDCEGCHKDLDSYTLKPNARDDFKKLLAAAGR